MTAETLIDRVGDDDLELVAIDTLEPHPENPRLHDDPTIQQSMRDHGVIDVCVVQRSRRRILGGHGRWENAIEVGATRVPVLWVDCDDDEAEEIMLVLNHAADKATYNNPALAKLLSRIADSGRSVQRAGWDETSLRRFVARVRAAEPAEPDDEPEPPAKIKRVTKPGDLWEMGDHRLLCGDARAVESYEIVLGGRRAQLVFSSPPYADRRTYDDTTEFRPIAPDEYVEWFVPVREHVRAVLADDGSWCLNIKEASDDGQRERYVLDLVVDHLNAGWRYVDEYVWPRPAFPFDPKSARRFKNGWEPVFHLAISAEHKFRPDSVMVPSDSTFTYDPEQQMQGSSATGFLGVGRGNKVPGMAYPSNVLQHFGVAATGTAHPAAFPVALPAWFVQCLTDVGDVVLDPFSGAASTIMAAHDHGRVGCGIELSPLYCDQALTRWQQRTGEKPTRNGRKVNFV